jgi:formylglycine-generating enzyme required for sulfatase activity
MQLSPKGNFLVGSSIGERDKQKWYDELPKHRVHIKNPFYLDKYLVTQEQWQIVMSNNPQILIKGIIIRWLLYIAICVKTLLIS